MSDAIKFYHDFMEQKEVEDLKTYKAMKEKVFSRKKLIEWSEESGAFHLFKAFGYSILDLEWLILADGLTAKEMAELDLDTADEWMVDRSEWKPSLDHGFTGQQILDGRTRLKGINGLEGFIIGGLW